MFDILDDEKKELDALKFAPLARRMRPQSIDEVIGQDEVLGEGKPLRRAIETDCLSSIILYGPAGCGKTSIACAIANSTSSSFEEVSAVSGSVSDIRKVISEARERLLNSGVKTILFVDEIHRFSKSQQDALLHAVEDRTVILIGATTENPYFEVNSALISRSRVVLIKSLDDESLDKLIDIALKSPLGLDGEYTLDSSARSEIKRLCGGDGRSALNILELASQQACYFDRDTIEKADVESVAPERKLVYDKGSDNHYDMISAFIKSMRGSDPDAALYWMARMLEAGEDPKFIARRIFICASEDIGNADPRAILVAEAAFRAVEVIGMPECAINLSQAATYMALADKSNAAVMGIESAFEEVRSGKERAVPAHLRDRHRPGSENYGQYKYPHDYEGNYTLQQYLPQGLERGDFYKAGSVGWESQQTSKLDELRKSKAYNDIIKN